jgi:phage-related protein
MKGQFGSVIEIREDFDRNTYRLMYVAKLGGVIYVLCAFQKKATKGVATSKHVLDRVLERLKQARTIHGHHGAES